MVPGDMTTAGQGLRILIVDDEQPARERLRHLLAGRADAIVIGEAADGIEAIERIAALAPDVVLLDIQMPGATGLDVAASLPAPRPAIIFCTAFEQHALDAFELHALDYVLKPVTRARLFDAIDRVAPVSAPVRDASLDRAQAGIGPVTRFVARRGARFVVIPASDVLYIASDDGLTRLQARDGHAWLSPSLGDLEQRLDPGHFFRVSRNAIVALDAIREVVPSDSGGDAVLADGTHLGVSRRRFADLLSRLGQA